MLTEAPRRALRLGVVIPALNEASTLPRLLAQLAEDGAERVFVVDGGSSDGTAGLAREHGAEVLSSPRGRGTQLAAGARAALADGCDVLFFLHADCVPAAGAIGRLRGAFADPDLTASAMSQEIEGEGLFYRLVERAADARSRRGLVFGDSGLAVRASAYEAVGGFRPLPLFEDIDLTRRLREHGAVRLLSQATLRVSARRWQREGALRCTLRNWMLRTLYRAGVAPERCARLYP